MNKLRLYLLKLFAADFLICLVSVFALYAVIDLSVNLGGFIETGRRDTASFMAAYYLVRVPLLFGKLAPAITLLAAAFTLTLLERRNELTPVKASGVSMSKFTSPLLAAAFAIGLLTAALEEWAVPWAGNQVVRRNLERSQSHLWNRLVRDGKGNLLVFYNAYYPSERKLLSLHASRTDERMREREAIFAEEAVYSRSRASWIMKNGYSIRFAGDGMREGPPESFEEKVLETSLLPLDMEARSRPDEFSLSELYARWKDHPSIPQLGVGFHSRAALGAAVPILIAIGMPIVLAGAHRRFFLSAVATAAVAGAYFALSQMFFKLGLAGHIPPVIAGWGPAILFSAAAAAVHDMIPT